MDFFNERKKNSKERGNVEGSKTLKRPEHIRTREKLFKAYQPREAVKVMSYIYKLANPNLILSLALFGSKG
jgi:hypothetical protein